MECLAGPEVLPRYDAPTTLFYLDPPDWGSETDFGAGVFTRADFNRLAVRLAAGEYELETDAFNEAMHGLAASVAAKEGPADCRKGGAARNGPAAPLRTRWPDVCRQGRERARHLSEDRNHHQGLQRLRGRSCVRKLPRSSAAVVPGLGTPEARRAPRRVRRIRRRARRRSPWLTSRDHPSDVLNATMRAGFEYCPTQQVAYHCLAGGGGVVRPPGPHRAGHQDRRAPDTRSGRRSPVRSRGENRICNSPQQR